MPDLADSSRSLCAARSSMIRAAPSRVKYCRYRACSWVRCHGAHALGLAWSRASARNLFRVHDAHHHARQLLACCTRSRCHVAKCMTAFSRHARRPRRAARAELCSPRPKTRRPTCRFRQVHERQRASRRWAAVEGQWAGAALASAGALQGPAAARPYSGIKKMEDGSFLILTDNGAGAKANLARLHAHTL